MINKISTKNIIFIIILTTSTIVAYNYGTNKCQSTLLPSDISTQHFQPTPTPTISTTKGNDSKLSNINNIDDQIFKQIEANYKTAYTEYKNAIEQDKLLQQQTATTSSQILAKAMQQNLTRSNLESYRKSYELALNAYIQALFIRAGRPDLAKDIRNNFNTRLYNEEIMNTLRKIDSKLSETIIILNQP